MKITKCWKINMMKIDPGAIGFTSGFSQEYLGDIRVLVDMCLKVLF